MSRENDKGIDDPKIAWNGRIQLCTVVSVAPAKQWK